ncbi:unnamed protein product [Linum tenue]|uniref:Uncharacterized protein n=1 Tax=Linum tenue TaxID=586396 RepID=A0AAV0NC75_9ROSI|nr:unnamed protein product [Linum tenue]
MKAWSPVKKKTTTTANGERQKISQSNQANDLLVQLSSPFSNLPIPAASSSRIQVYDDIDKATPTFMRRASLAIGIAGGASIVICSVTCSPAVAYAMDGVDILMDDDREPFDASDRDEFAHAAWMVIRKLWLPAFFVLTIVSNWNNPIVLFTKGVLLLLATRPSPLTVYLFVEQSLYAKKVEVQDYKFLCIAAVEVRDRRFTLVGILGGWWVLPLSREAFSSFWESALY